MIHSSLLCFMINPNLYDISLEFEIVSDIYQKNSKVSSLLHKKDIPFVISYCFYLSIYNIRYENYKEFSGK